MQHSFVDLINYVYQISGWTTRPDTSQIVFLYLGRINNNDSVGHEIPSIPTTKILHLQRSCWWLVQAVQCSIVAQLMVAGSSLLASLQDVWTLLALQKKTSRPEPSTSSVKCCCRPRSKVCSYWPMDGLLRYGFWRRVVDTLQLLHGWWAGNLYVQSYRKAELSLKLLV